MKNKLIISIGLMVIIAFIFFAYLYFSKPKDLACVGEGGATGGSTLPQKGPCCPGLKAVPDWDTSDSKIIPPGAGYTCKKQ